MQKRALIVGASGVIGTALSEHLLSDDWKVTGLSRGRGTPTAGVHMRTADLTSRDEVASALNDVDVDAVFFAAWARQATEKENIRVNGAMVSNVLNVMGPSLQNGHAALVTGLKHYLGPFEAYGTGAVPKTPFREEQGRQPVENFYYEQEDRLFEAASRFGFTWSVHRPHTIIGYALGNAMNMGVTLASWHDIWNGRRPVISQGTKISTSQTAMYFDGNGCGRRLRTTLALKRHLSTAYCVRWKIGCRTAPGSGRRSLRNLSSRSLRLKTSYPGGIRTPTLDDPWRW